MSKTTRKTYPPKLKTTVAIDVARGERTLSQVAAAQGAGPSLAAGWRDGPLDGADDAFGRTRQERERKRSEEAAQGKRDEAPRKIGWPAAGRGFTPCPAITLPHAAPCSSSAPQRSSSSKALGIPRSSDPVARTTSTASMVACESRA